MANDQAKIRKAVEEALLAAFLELKKIYNEEGRKEDASLLMAITRAHSHINQFSLAKLKRILVAIERRFNFYGIKINKEVREKLEDAIGQVGAYEIFEMAKKAT